MNHATKSDIRYSGVKAGLLCALVGSALFSIIEVARLGIRDSSFIGKLDAITLILFNGCIFSSIPAGIGGFVLGVILKNQMRKGSLTPGKAVMTGILLAGLAAMITWGLVILFLTFGIYLNWHYLWDAVRQGTFFTNFLNDLRDDLEFAIALGPEILTALSIACIAGGWTGGVLAKRLLSQTTDI
jgi:hypothetical protein